MIVTAKSQHLHLLVIQLLDWFTWRVIDCCGFLRIIEGFATIGSKVANVISNKSLDTSECLWECLWLCLPSLRRCLL
jgi:hypothetical protein